MNLTEPAWNPNQTLKFYQLCQKIKEKHVQLVLHSHYNLIFLLLLSALQLTDDAIHLSLSPTRMTPANSLNNNGIVDVTTSTEPNKLNKFNNGNAVLKKEMSTGDLTNNYELTFREVAGTGITKSAMQRSTSWYDGFFGCLKPVWSFMGKNKPSNLQNPNEGKVLTFEKYFTMQFIPSIIYKRSKNTENHIFIEPWYYNSRGTRFKKILSLIKELGQVLYRYNRRQTHCIAIPGNNNSIGIQNETFNGHGLGYAWLRIFVTCEVKRMSAQFIRIVHAFPKFCNINTISYNITFRVRFVQFKADIY